MLVYQKEKDLHSNKTGEEKKNESKLSQKGGKGIWGTTQKALQLYSICQIQKVNSGAHCLEAHSQVSLLVIQ